MPSDNERVQAVAAALKQRAHGMWWALMLRGVLALVLGLSALIWPKLTLSLLIQLTGFYVLLDGFAGLVSGIRGRDLSSYLLPSLVSLVVGAVLLFWPGMTGQWLLIVLGTLILLHGGSLYMAGRSAMLDDPDRSAVMTTGALLAGIGLVLIIWPGVGVVTLSWLVAAAAIVIGLILIYFALTLRRVNERVKAFGDMSQ